MRVQHALFVSLALCACASDPSRSSGRAADGAAASAPMGGEHGIVVYSAGEDAWFADPRDRGLRAALDLVDERLAELPAELDEPQFPHAALAFLLDVVRHPMDLRAGFVEKTDEGLPFRAQLTVRNADATDAQGMAQRFAGLLAQYGVPSLGKNTSKHGLGMVPLGPLAGYHGAPDDGADRTFVIAVNEIDRAPLEVGSLGLPRGVEPFCAMKIDYGVLSRIAEMNGADDNPMLAALHDMVIESAWGYGDDRMHGVARARNWMGSLRAMSVAPTRPLREREIEMVPVDATWATLGTSGLSGVPNWIRALTASQPELQGMDPIEALATYTGFDVEKELFLHLGETWGVYASDTTGGGGLLSTVAFLEVLHPAEIEKALDWMASELANASETHARGYVTVRKSKSGAGPRWSLTFPGLPVPLEAVVEMAGGYLFAGLSPQAVTAAARQAANPKKSLLDQSRFEEMAEGDLDDLYSLAYFDTPRAARDGYALTAHACAALANATRSKLDPARDAGAILPPYHDLVDGTKPWVVLGRLDGDDLVTTSQGDRSLLANASAIVGCYQGAVAAVAAGVAAIRAIGTKQAGDIGSSAALLPGAEPMDPAAIEEMLRKSRLIDTTDPDGDLDDATDDDMHEPDDDGDADDGAPDPH